MNLLGFEFDSQTISDILLAWENGESDLLC